VALGKQKLSLPTFVRSSQLNTLAATYAAKRKQQAWPKRKAHQKGGSAERKVEKESLSNAALCVSIPTTLMRCC